jgi:hypothetical protein
MLARVIEVTGLFSAGNKLGSRRQEAGLCAHETATLDADISAGLDVHGEG